jgi:hypothetical protein
MGLLVFTGAGALAQDGAGTLEADTSAGEIERLRRLKQQTLRPATLPWLHRTILYVRENRIPEKITYGYKGLRPRFGTLGPGSGFGLGIEYFRSNLGDERYAVRTSLTGSLQEFFMADAEFEARRIGGKGFVNILAFHRFSPSIDFYGVGPSSAEANRTAYSLEENNAQVSAGWEVIPRLRGGVLGRHLTANVGETRNRDRVSVERVFGPPELPGLGAEPPYVEAGAFLELSENRELGAPPGGTRAAVRWSHYNSQKSGASSFTRLDAFTERHQMFLNQQRAVLVRARMSLSVPQGGNVIPFYLQPQLGGPFDLRGFAGRRFYDNNLMTATAEYHWQVFSGMWLAVFADAGKVFPHWNKWGLDGLESSYGMGVRFGSSEFGAGRFDVAFSREGGQFWVVFATF